MNTTVYNTKTELKERGWTDAMIKKFLPEPDKTRPNPMFKKGAPVCLYLLERVESIMGTEEFKDYDCKSKARKKSAKQGVETKKRKVIDWINGLLIEIPDFDKEVLIEKACEHFNNNKKNQKSLYDEWASHHYEEAYENEIYDLAPDFSMASPKSDEDFIARISTNYIRHECTTYEKQLDKMFGKTGKDIGHDLLKSRINEAIHRKYPWTVRNEEYKPE